MEQIKLKPYINNIINLLTKTDFQKDQLQQIIDLKEHLEMQIKLIGCAEYLDGINLSADNYSLNFKIGDNND